MGKNSWFFLDLLKFPPLQCIYQKVHPYRGAFGFVGVSVLAIFYVGVSVLEEKSVGISVLDMRCGDGKVDFFGRYFGNSSNIVGDISYFKGSQRQNKGYFEPQNPQICFSNIEC